MVYKSCLMVILTLILIVLGCSVSSPVTPEKDSDSKADLMIETIQGFSGQLQQIEIITGTMVIDPNQTDGDVIQYRDSDWNYNITGFLSSGCSGGCLKYQIVGVVGTVLEIEVTIENPTNLQVYDVRLIYDHLHGKTVMNPDSYTDMFKPGNIRPYTAFAKHDPTRAFPVGPYATDTQTMFLDFPPGAPVYVDYIVIASLPACTQDPYEINGMSQDGKLTPSGGSSVIGCFVLDHQRDVSSVVVDTSPITGGATYLDPASGVDYLWFKEITNSEGAPVGTYTCLIHAQSPNPQQASTYNYIDIKVEEESAEWGDIEVVHLSDDGWYSVDPDVAFDSEGYAHICWTEVENVGTAQWNENIWYSNNISGSWSAPVELSDAFQNINDYIICPSAIAINNEDQICVVWSQELYNGDRPKLWWNFFDSGTWIGQTQMFDLWDMEVQPQLYSDDHFFYLAFRHGYECGSIMFSRWAMGTGWTLPVDVSDPIDMIYRLQMDGKCSITAASRGGIFLTWLFYDMNPDGIWQVMRDESWDGGSSWGPDTIDICDEYIAQGKPSIAMDAASNLFSLWITGMDQIRWDQYMHGGGWGPDQILYDHFGASYPAFDVMPNAHQHVCYIDAKILPIRLSYIESKDGAVWTTPEMISPDEGECEMPSVATWGINKVGVTWKQHLENYTNDILYREKSS